MVTEEQIRTVCRHLSGATPNNEIPMLIEILLGQQAAPAVSLGQSWLLSPLAQFFLWLLANPLNNRNNRRRELRLLNAIANRSDALRALFDRAVYRSTTIARDLAPGTNITSLHSELNIIFSRYLSAAGQEQCLDIVALWIFRDEAAGTDPPRDLLELETIRQQLLVIPDNPSEIPWNEPRRQNSRTTTSNQNDGTAPSPMHTNFCSQEEEQQNPDLQEENDDEGQNNQNNQEEDFSRASNSWSNWGRNNNNWHGNWYGNSWNNWNSSNWNNNGRGYEREYTLQDVVSDWKTSSADFSFTLPPSTDIVPIVLADQSVDLFAHAGSKIDYGKKTIVPSVFRACCRVMLAHSMSIRHGAHYPLIRENLRLMWPPQVWTAGSFDWIFPFLDALSASCTPNEIETFRRLCVPTGLDAQQIQNNWLLLMRNGAVFARVTALTLCLLNEQPPAIATPKDWNFPPFSATFVDDVKVQIKFFGVTAVVPTLIVTSVTLAKSKPEAHTESITHLTRCSKIIKRSIDDLRGGLGQVMPLTVTTTDENIKTASLMQVEDMMVFAYVHSANVDDNLVARTKISLQTTGQLALKALKTLGYADALRVSILAGARAAEAPNSLLTFCSAIIELHQHFENWEEKNKAKRQKREAANKDADSPEERPLRYRLGLAFQTVKERFLSFDDSDKERFRKYWKGYCEISDDGTVKVDPKFCAANIVNHSCQYGGACRKQHVKGPSLKDWK